MSFCIRKGRSWLGAALSIFKRLQTRIMSLALERPVSLSFIEVFMGLSFRRSVFASLRFIYNSTLAVRGYFRRRFDIL